MRRWKKFSTSAPSSAKVKINVGAVTASYKGRVTFAEIDEQSHSMKMLAEAQAISILPLLLRTLWEAILRFFRRLFGRQSG